jgi:hypothetical protein
LAASGIRCTQKQDSRVAHTDLLGNGTGEKNQPKRVPAFFNCSGNHKIFFVGKNLRHLRHFSAL